MNTISVMVGLPGSGKSTFLKFVDDPEFGDTVFVYSTDNYIEKVAKNSGTTYDAIFKDQIKPAELSMNSMLNVALSMGVDVYWDQTNMTAKKRRSIISKFPKSYYKECICIVPPRSTDEWKELDRRLDNRPGKTIPMHVIEFMSNIYVEPELEEGFDYIRIYDIYGKEIKTKGVPKNA